MNMILLQQRLTEFENYLDENSNSLLRRFQDGLQPDVVTNLLDQLSVPVEDLYLLYTWKNGVDYEAVNKVGELDFFSFGFMLSIKDAIRHYYSFPVALQKKAFPFLQLEEVTISCWI